MGDFWSVFPGNQMQAGSSSVEEDGVGVWFILCQLMFTALLSVPVITQLPLCGWTLICTHELQNSEPCCHRSHQSRKGLMNVALSETVQVDVCIIIGYYWDGDELCVLSIAMTKIRGTLWLAVKSLCTRAGSVGQHSFVSKWENSYAVQLWRLCLEAQRQVQQNLIQCQQIKP